MLQHDDLEAAIGAGVITQAQADALLAFAASRRGGTAGLRADEERFRFMRGFNDFFFAIGVVLLGAGLSIYAGLNANILIYGLSALVTWGLAELLVGRLRLVLPGIVIALFFVNFVVLALPLWLLNDLAPGLFRTPFTGVNPMMAMMISGGTLAVAIKAAVASLAAFLFYVRFRFPFALLIVAFGAVVAVDLAAAYLLFGNSTTVQLLLMLVSGVAVFGAAMWFDLSDRLRATRRADCAFWLHVLAAPLMVHSLVGIVSRNTFHPDNYAAVMIIAVALLMTLVALIIDRRALLVSALVYVGSVIAYALSNASADRTFILIATLVILGILVLALGVGWAPLRRRVASLMSPKIMDRLPPVVSP